MSRFVRGANLPGHLCRERVEDWIVEKTHENIDIECDYGDYSLSVDLYCIQERIVPK